MVPKTTSRIPSINGSERESRPPSPEPFRCPRVMPTTGNRDWGKCQVHAAETALPSDLPARVLRAPWHLGHKTPILIRESALIPCCTRFPPFPGPASPACRGEPAPDAPYIRNALATQGPRPTGRQRSPTATGTGHRGDSDSDLRQRRHDRYGGDRDSDSGNNEGRPSDIQPVRRRPRCGGRRRR